MKRKKQTHVVRWPGLCTAAQVLGVHRCHLYMVLVGKRTSHRLTARYHALVSAHPERAA